MQINGCQVLISGSYNAFNEGWNGAGVYMASGNYQSQTFKNPIYIGGSSNLQRRIEQEHISRLQRNKHENFPFQFGWNKHAENEGFIWLLLESCDNCEPEKTLETEQKYLDLYRPFADEFGGFNICHFVNIGALGTKQNEETRLRRSQAQKGKEMLPHVKEKLLQANLGRKFTEEHKRKISQGNTGKHSQKPEKFISDLVERSSKFYRLISPDGKVFEIKNLSKFARENNLGKANICAVANGKLPHHKGWKCFHLPP